MPISSHVLTNQSVLHVVGVFLFLHCALLCTGQELPPIGTSTVYPCSDCDYVVREHTTDGKILNILPGQVVCLSSSISYKNLVFRNINGSPNMPVIIKNCGGTVKLYATTSFGLKFEQSKHFKLLGDGGPDQYGIVVTTEKGFYITMEKFSTDFEIANVEAAGSLPKGIGDNAGFAGIGVKTSPYQDCDRFTDPQRKAWVMKNIKIHDNYIHDTGGEGMYIGHGFYTGRKEPQCPTITYSHAIKNITIYNNRIENIGYDGIQIKNANENVLVYQNLIRNYGTRNESAHNEGLFIGEGSTGSYYGNIIDTGSGNGIQLQGLGNITISNNLILNAGENGIYCASGKYVERFPDGFFRFTRNTIFSSSQFAFVFYNNEGGIKTFSENYLAGSGSAIKKGADVTFSKNEIKPEATMFTRGHVNLFQHNTGIEQDVISLNPFAGEYLK